MYDARLARSVRRPAEWRVCNAVSRGRFRFALFSPPDGFRSTRAPRHLPTHLGQHSPGSICMLLDGHWSTGHAFFEQVSTGPAVDLSQWQVRHGSSYRLTFLQAATSCPITRQPVERKTGYYKRSQRYIINNNSPPPPPPPSLVPDQVRASGLRDVGNWFKNITPMVVPSFFAWVYFLHFLFLLNCYRQRRQSRRVSGSFGPEVWSPNGRDLTARSDHETGEIRPSLDLTTKIAGCLRKRKLTPRTGFIRNGVQET